MTLRLSATATVPRHFMTKVRQRALNFRKPPPELSGAMLTINPEISRPRQCSSHDKAHVASNRLFLSRLVHGCHRPILDLLPSLLHRGRQLVHVLQKQHKRPYIPIAEGVWDQRIASLKPLKQSVSAHIRSLAHLEAISHCTTSVPFFSFALTTLPPEGPSSSPFWEQTRHPARGECRGESETQRCARAT